MESHKLAFSPPRAKPRVAVIGFDTLDPQPALVLKLHRVKPTDWQRLKYIVYVSLFQATKRRASALQPQSDNHCIHLPPFCHRTRHQ